MINSMKSLISVVLLSGGLFAQLEAYEALKVFEPFIGEWFSKHNSVGAFEGLPKNKQGYFRLLETNKRVILPTNTHLRLLVTAADVLHSWTIPSFGLKVDACPDRLNQINLFIKRVGVFFGQCSEICGVNHGFMPIVVVSLPTLQFHHYVMTKLELG